MSETVLFLFNSALLGIGLAMDALSVSLANGMNEPTMKRGKCSSSQECLADFRADAADRLGLRAYLSAVFHRL